MPVLSANSRRELEIHRFRQRPGCQREAMAEEVVVISIGQKFQKRRGIVEQTSQHHDDLLPLGKPRFSINEILDLTPAQPLQTQGRQVFLKRAMQKEIGRIFILTRAHQEPVVFPARDEIDWILVIF